MLKDYSRAHTHIVSHRDHTPTPPYTFSRVPRPHAANTPTRPTARGERSSANHHPASSRDRAAKPTPRTPSARAPPPRPRARARRRAPRAVVFHATQFARARHHSRRPVVTTTARIIPDVPRAANLASHPRARFDPHRIARVRDTATARTHATKKRLRRRTSGVRVWVRCVCVRRRRASKRDCVATSSRVVVIPTQSRGGRLLVVIGRLHDMYLCPTSNLGVLT